jgi:hypothetical protein
MRIVGCIAFLSQASPTAEANPLDALVRGHFVSSWILIMEMIGKPRW